MKHNFFDSIIKDKANSHEAAVPAGAWNNINKKRKKRSRIFWWSFAALLIALSIFGVYKFRDEHHLAMANIHDRGKENVTTNNKKISSKTNNKNGIANNAVTKSNIEKDIIANDAVYQTTANSSKTNVNLINSNVKSEDDKTNLLEKAEIQKGKNNLKRRGKFSVRTKAGKASSDYSILTATTVSKKARREADKSETTTLWNSSKRNKSFKQRTAIKTTAPTASDAVKNDNVDTTIATGELPSATIEKIAGDNKDSLNAVASNISNNFKNKAPDTAAKQTSAKIKYKPKNIFVDISTMPFLPIQKNASLANIKRTTMGNLSRSEYTADDITTSMDASFSYTIALRKQIAAKWYAGIGVQYVQLKENIMLSGKEINTQYSVIKRLDNTGSFLVDDTVATVTKGTRVINAVNSYQFISLPVFAQYQILQNKAWQLSVNGGLNFTVKKIYQNSIAGTWVPDYTSATLANKKEHTISTDIFASLRLARGLGKNYSIYAEPTLQFNLTQYNMRNMIDYKYIHKAGLSIGIAYKLNY